MAGEKIYHRAQQGGAFRALAQLIGVQPGQRQQAAGARLVTQNPAQRQQSQYVRGETIAIFR